MQKPLTTEIPLFEYSKSRFRWLEVTSPEVQVALPAELSLLTYNTWFDRFAQEMRYREQLKMIEENMPDVVCLQEVTQQLLAMIEGELWCQKNYYLTDMCTNLLTFQGRYGVVMMLKRTLPIQKVFHSKLFSEMGRCCISAKIANDKTSILIGTVHLESLDQRKIRMHQLRAICKYVLTDSDNCILAGDFNFDDERNFDPSDKEPIENTIFSTEEHVKPYVDIWTLFHEPGTGKTRDTTVNKMLKGEKEEHMRYDRVILKSSTVTAKNIDLLGTSQVGYFEEKSVFPSDHFALLAKFSV